MTPPLDRETLQAEAVELLREHGAVGTVEQANDWENRKEALIIKLDVLATPAAPPRVETETLQAAREFVTLANTIWESSPDGQCAKELAEARMGELARIIMESASPSPTPGVETEQRYGQAICSHCGHTAAYRLEDTDAAREALVAHAKACRARAPEPAQDGARETRERTHWDGCYTSHLDCAVAEITSLQSALAQVDHFLAYRDALGGGDRITRLTALLAAAKTNDPKGDLAKAVSALAQAEQELSLTLSERDKAEAERDDARREAAALLARISGAL